MLSEDTDLSHVCVSVERKQTSYHWAARKPCTSAEPRSNAPTQPSWCPAPHVSWPCVTLKATWRSSLVCVLLVHCIRDSVATCTLTPVGHISLNTECPPTNTSTEQKIQVFPNQGNHIINKEGWVARKVYRGNVNFKPTCIRKMQETLNARISNHNFKISQNR